MRGIHSIEGALKDVGVLLEKGEFPATQLGHVFRVQLGILVGASQGIVKVVRGDLIRTIF